MFLMILELELETKKLTRYHHNLKPILTEKRKNS